MNIKKIAASTIAAAVLSMPLSMVAQESHYDAVRQTHYHDARHHTKAKWVAGSAVGGALIGAKVGGPGGALIGAGAGAVGGLALNKAYRHHEIHKREKYGHPYYR